jgi:hypothetical protein
MKTPINDDNRYKQGTIISARIDPTIQLRILEYKERIYYCDRVDQLDKTILAYFERELLPPEITSAHSPKDGVKFFSMPVSGFLFGLLAPRN